MSDLIPIRRLPMQVAGNLKPLAIGYQLEHQATEVLIDARPWLEKWPDATIALIVTRPGEETSYPADMTEEDGVYRWLISRYDTEIVGMAGRIVLTAMQGEQEVASNTAMIHVLERGNGPIVEDTPLPEPPWMDTVVHRAESAARRAEDAAERAENAGGGVYFTTDDKTVSLSPDKVLSVMTTDQAVSDDPRPITAQGVYNEFAVINALLKTI